MGSKDNYLLVLHNQGSVWIDDFMFYILVDSIISLFFMRESLAHSTRFGKFQREHFPTCFQIPSSFSVLLPSVSAAWGVQCSWPLQRAICLFYLWKQNKFLCVLFYFLHDRIFCFHLQPLQLPRIFTPCGLLRCAGFNSLPPGPGPRSRIPSFSFPVLCCILQGPSPYIAVAVVTKGTGTRHTPAATVTAAEHSPSSNDNSMTSDTLLRKKNLKGRAHLKADNNTLSQCSALFLQAQDRNALI